MDQIFDQVMLARIQFAMTIGFHYIFPPLTIGLAWIIVWFQTSYLRTKNNFYKEVASFWIKLFALSFAVGVATGITMEFQFGTNWADYSRFVGDIFGAPLAAEGLFAFFLESTFIGVLLYGERKVSEKVYWFSGLMVAVGSTLSAFWIIVANSWQQTPAGYVITNGRAELVDFIAAVFNPSTLPRYFHTITGALITGAFFVMGISAYYLVRNIHKKFAEESFLVALKAGFISTVLVMFIGHWHAVQVANTQPAKLAAFEGIWETTKGAPLLAFGIPDEEKELNYLEVKIPYMLGVLVGKGVDGEVVGLKDFPKEDRPPVMLPFMSFHLMVLLGGVFFFYTMLGLFFFYVKKDLFLEQRKWFVGIAPFLIPLPFVANEVGWIAAEVGRQPWIVQGILKTKDSISRIVSAGEILFSIILFALIYAVLFYAWITLLKKKIVKGPTIIH